MTKNSLTIAALALMASLAFTTSAQVKSVSAANNHPSAKSNDPKQGSGSATRSRVIGQEPKGAASKSAASGSTTVPSDAKSGFNSNSESARLRSANTPAEKTSLPPVRDRANDRLKLGHTVLKPTLIAVSKPTSTNTTPAPAPANSTPTAPSAPISAVPTQIYRVGIRDVLDIQLPNNPARVSTLFTVKEDGLLEYPLAGSPISVAGLTTPEIATLLRQRLKVFDNPAVVVKVRDYASHSVTITGFVGAPGTKFLRREAMPLYTILAESLVLPGAGSATITRQGSAPIVVDLKDEANSSTMVLSGDAITVLGSPATPTEFFFIGGGISSPGQKPYHAGLTLTQAILASGGINGNSGSKIKISRQGADGLLTTTEYNLRKIQSGKTPDPILQKGDRIEVK